MIIKRIFDILFAILLLILGLPILLIFSLIIFLELKSWPIYVQERGLTLEKNRFSIYKLKTIRPRDENILHKSEEDIFLKPALKNKVSQFSKWLRKTGLDELPQLFNVVIGNMAFIGPRPLMLEDLETMKRVAPELYERRNKLNCLSGITGLWQLFGNRSEGIIGMVALESLYEKVQSPLLDLKLLAFTTTVVLQAKNSDSIFHVDKANPTRVKTVIDSSSNLKVTLNMPEGIAKFIVENVEKHEGKYTVELPQNWWYVSDSYDSAKKKSQKPQIYPIDKKSKKTAS